MFARQVKRKCSVRGCKNTDCVAISRTREVGNTIIICKSCLGDGLKAIDEINPKTKSNIPSLGNTSIPPLFYHSDSKKAEPKAPDAEEVTSDQTITEEAEVSTPSASDVNKAEDTTAEIVCPKCGREFGSENGLKSHLRYCKA